jgi:hypothetical protein
MFLQTKNYFDVRLHGISIDLQRFDITSYLSAPNLTNICTTHVGTIYRIFTDLTDMGFLIKHTSLYILATHNMGKIIQTFDPERGQVRKTIKED